MLLVMPTTALGVLAWGCAFSAALCLGRRSVPCVSAAAQAVGSSRCPWPVTAPGCLVYCRPESLWPESCLWGLFVFTELFLASPGFWPLSLLSVILGHCALSPCWSYFSLSVRRHGLSHWMNSPSQALLPLFCCPDGFCLSCYQFLLLDREFQELTQLLCSRLRRLADLAPLYLPGTVGFVRLYFLTFCFLIRGRILGRHRVSKTGVTLLLRRCHGTQREAARLAQVARGACLCGIWDEGRECFAGFSHADGVLTRRWGSLN